MTEKISLTYTNATLLEMLASAGGAVSPNDRAHAKGLTVFMFEDSELLEEVRVRSKTLTDTVSPVFMIDRLGK